MKTLRNAALVLAVAAALGACNDSSDNDSNSDDAGATSDGGASSGTYTLKGTVPGTLIEAFCDDGSYFSAHSVVNGSDRHPFSLDLPRDVACRLAMTTNEGSADGRVITPVRLVSGGSGSIAFSNDDDALDLGHVSLALSRAEMRSDQNGDGVEDTPLDVALTDAERQAIRLVVKDRDPLDKDGDGIPNVYEDLDDDGIPNRYDDDDDGDGLPDIEDHDADGDGQDDNDLDGDGIENGKDHDDDNDGIHDDKDDDDDNDGIHDRDDDDDDNDGTPDSKDPDSHAYTPVDPGTPTAGRLLASQCAQCHGTDGRSRSDIDSLAGESANEIIEEMLEMQADSTPGIMDYHARGYTTEQIRAIGGYFGGISGNGYDRDDDDDD